MFSRIKIMFTAYRELYHLAYHDSLTGLYNRNWLHKNINKIDAKYVYFIDINNLHAVNLQGHIVGDEYIKRAINSIQHSGTLIRYAGDEFILFSDTSNEVVSNSLFTVGTAIVGNDLKQAIAEADINMLKNKTS